MTTEQGHLLSDIRTGVLNAVAATAAAAQALKPASGSRQPHSSRHCPPKQPGHSTAPAAVDTAALLQLWRRSGQTACTGAAVNTAAPHPAAAIEAVQLQTV